jgi:2-haloacid dehalogenase
MSALGFDVYGTLVDPLAMREPLRALAGDKAERLSEVWRCNQLQYTWRRGLMRRYENFDVCTRQALQAAMATVGVALSAADQDQLMAAYLNLTSSPT